MWLHLANVPHQAVVSDVGASAHLYDSQLCPAHPERAHFVTTQDVRSVRSIALRALVLWAAVDLTVRVVVTTKDDLVLFGLTVAKDAGQAQMGIVASTDTEG